MSLYNTVFFTCLMLCKKYIDLGTYLIQKNIFEIVLISNKMHIINVLADVFEYGLDLPQRTTK